jgi:hypothetical protein
MPRTLGVRRLTATLLVSLTTVASFAAEDAPRVLTRLIYQDDATHAVKWVDLQQKGDQLTTTAAVDVAGFPALDTDKQSLVQMEAAHGFILVGVRDDDNGAFGSGWVLIDTGVAEEEHGDHSHWDYPRTPKVVASRIDTQQGNPAHLYGYDNVFYVANDKKNGFTRFDPAGLKPTDTAETIARRAVFHPGGGGHITLAASGGMAYSSWIDRDGEHKGRVDVTPLSAGETPQIALSFQLPHGGIHGATAVSGKVFFAPTDGICWVQALAAAPTASTVMDVKHLSLGQVGEQPRRTGSFNSFGRFVAFTTGGGPAAQLTTIDAAETDLKPVHLAVPMAEGQRPSGLEIVTPRKGSPWAFVFHGQPAGGTAPNQLSLIELDPNTDGRLDDAKVAVVLEVGKALVNGHGGHHSVAFDADRRRAIFTNPGDGNLTVLTLKDRQVAAQLKIGGTPSKLIAVGGRASDH